MRAAMRRLDAHYAPAFVPRADFGFGTNLEHFQVKWIRFTVENAARQREELIP
jgi:hypothetical protein